MFVSQEHRYWNGQFCCGLLCYLKMILNKYMGKKVLCSPPLQPCLYLQDLDSGYHSSISTAFPSGIFSFTFSMKFRLVVEQSCLNTNFVSQQISAIQVMQLHQLNFIIWTQRHKSCTARYDVLQHAQDLLECVRVCAEWPALVDGDRRRAAGHFRNGLGWMGFPWVV